MEMKLTVSGLFEYDDTLFDYLNLPAAADKETAVWTILENTEDFEVLYPDADYLKESIKYWSRAMQNSWTRLWDALHEEYDPLYNFDRHEIISETTSGDNTQTLDTTETGAKTAYNVDNFKDTDRKTQGGTISNEGSGSRDVTTHLYGNIGVTTSQEMLKAEIKLIPELDFYKRIAQEFAEKFCILVY